MSIYYDWSKMDGYHCPIKIVIARRGIGKTFFRVKKCTENFITKGRRFIYVVETGDMVKELARNNGEKFWAAILKYYGEQDTSKKRYFYNKLTKLEVVEEEENSGLFETKVKAKMIGGTIKIDGETAGYVVDMNSFGEIKRNNFDRVGTVIIDEFISEKLDKTALENPKKISSIIQSICRLRKDVEIFMLGNSIRTSDPILARMGFKLKEYGIYKKYDKHGLFAVLHFVNPSDYQEFAKAHEASVAGRFASMLRETNEEENTFIEDLPETRRLNELKYRKNGISFSVAKDDVIITFRELDNGCYACVPFASRGARSIYCLSEKEQGYKLGYHLICNKALKQTLMNWLRADIIYYYSEIEYSQLKYIIKGV